MGLPEQVMENGPAPFFAWDLANEYPATSIAGEGDIEFARHLGRVSAGRVRICVKTDGAAGLNTREQFEAVSAGRIMLADSFAGALVALHPLFQLPSLPFLTLGTDDARLLFNLARPHYERVLAGLGQKLLYASPWPPTGLWTRFPIADVQTLNGLRVRTYDVGSAQVFGRMGAKAFYTPFTQALGLLAAGELDGVMSSGDGGAGARLWPVLPCFTPLHYAVPLSLTTMNLASWNELDVGLQADIEACAAATMRSLWQRMGARVKENYGRLRQAGGVVAPALSPVLRAAFGAAAEVVMNDWLAQAGDEGKMLLSAFRAAKSEQTTGIIR